MHNGSAFGGCAFRRAVFIDPVHGCGKPKITRSALATAGTAVGVGSGGEVVAGSGLMGSGAGAGTGGAGYGQVAGEANESVVGVVDRGVCTFTDKVRAVQNIGSALTSGQAGGAAAATGDDAAGGAGAGAGAGASASTRVQIGAVLVANNKDEIIDLPAGRAPVGDLTVAALSVTSVDGKILQDVIAWTLDVPLSHQVHLWIGAPDDPCAAGPPPNPSGVKPPGAKPRPPENKGGRFDVLTSYKPDGVTPALAAAAAAARPFGFHQALFGPDWPSDRPVRLVAIADLETPSKIGHACTQQTYGARVKVRARVRVRVCVCACV